ncbi:MAG TPA: SUMF1/EgtB/PvdO family nonheme iron enzyme [Actinophytocola sp.]|uniref:SUMF1/EgtB/PvdO family nonheme iron enzyme n=1 Tax=Actinophytocola sp. TaxID=1872138 RepID=UPI002DDD1750|nr:SUMF1/EgtB/PvdO family nonheme iron enzyme [Actinophytocola sp.]HEV2780513.1 SUMF1/EgtB/PvdO family nonheme iron enzyme [Actinophytocola sp.]
MGDWRAPLDELDRQLRAGQPHRMRETLARLSAAAGRAPAHEVEELASVAAMHPQPWVRHTLLMVLAGRHPERADTRELVQWLTHDYEDFVAFKAIALAGALRLEDVLRELIVIVGRASRRLHGHAGKPVGIGHAVVLRAITELAGTSSRAGLAALEERLFPGGDEDGEEPPLPPVDAERSGTHTHVGMAPVPGGTVKGGAPPAFSGRELLFDWADPVMIGSCKDFHLDVLPVTNAEYDRFAGGTAATEHTYCHPAEPAGKLHLRNTLLDERSRPDHPVVGVDWFDAYAYARSLGKRLPTEAEWQRAAQGDDERAYPWGDAFDRARTSCHDPSDNGGWQGILDWRADLLALADTAPRHTTRANGMPGNVSPYGVRDLSGNVWEWTASSFGGAPFSPADADADAIDVIYDARSYAVIKGGAWSCLPEQLSVAFRGRDLALDRHFEIGFRCACSCPH